MESYEVLPLSYLKEDTGNDLHTDPCMMNLEWVNVSRYDERIKEARKLAQKYDGVCLVSIIDSDGKKKVLSYFNSKFDLHIVLFNAKKALFGGDVFTPPAYFSSKKLHVKYKKGSVIF